MIKASHICNGLAPYIGTMKTLNVKFTNTKRGSSLNASNYKDTVIKRNGEIILGSFSESASIYLEGGNASWEGALKDDSISQAFTPIQYSIMREVENWVYSRNSKISITWENQSVRD
jgi:hypothetical protein